VRPQPGRCGGSNQTAVQSSAAASGLLNADRQANQDQQEYQSAQGNGHHHTRHHPHEHPRVPVIRMRIMADGDEPDDHADYPERGHRQ